MQAVPESCPAPGCSRGICYPQPAALASASFRPRQLLTLHLLELQHLPRSAPPQVLLAFCPFSAVSPTQPVLAPVSCASAAAPAAAGCTWMKEGEEQLSRCRWLGSCHCCFQALPGFWLGLRGSWQGRAEAAAAPVSSCHWHCQGAFSSSRLLPPELGLSHGRQPRH